MKKYLTSCLDAADRDKVETAKVRVSFRKSVAVNIEDEGALPADFVVETVSAKPDKTVPGMPPKDVTRAERFRDCEERT